MNEFTAVDIFSGAGGLSVGARMAGINPVLAVEYDVHAASTYKRNHSEIASNILQKDIATVNPLEHTKKHPFIVFGGPPCQGFSSANTKTRHYGNKNNWMFLHYLRFVRELEPEWFLFENVAGFKSFEKGELAIHVELELQSLGYVTNSAILSAADYGVPQNRNRFFIVGHKESKGGIKFDFSSLQKQKAVSIHEAIADLPELANGDKVEKTAYRFEPHSDYAEFMRGKCDYATQNFVSQNRPEIIKRYEVICQGENWQAAKEKGMLDTYTSTKHTHSGIYKRLEAVKPSVTISNYRKSMLIHPYEHRGLSVREAARLQSFPDSFIFEGPLGCMQQQVGNAVPPLLAKTIFQKILSYKCQNSQQLL